MDLVRVCVLICCCLLTFGSYFSYDLPGALTDDFRDVLAQGDAGHQGLFYSLYSLPNTVQPFFGGIIIDQVLGLRRGALICCSLVALGCTIVAVAASDPAWSGTSTAFVLALAGRFVFGLGGETLSVCQNAFCAKWFRGADLATAFAIVLSFARVGSAVNFAIEPKVASEYSFSVALWLSSLLCLVSLGACALLGVVDLKFEHMTAEEEDDSEDSESDGEAHDAGLNDRLLDHDGQSSSRQLTRSHSLTDADAEAGAGGTEPLRANNGNAVDAGDEADEADKSKASFLAMLKSVLGPREILIYLICVQFYIAVFIFIAVASKFLKDTFDGVDQVQAGLLTSLPYTVSAVVSPLLGFSMDKVGRSGVFVGLACLGLSAVHITFAFFSDYVQPTAVMVFLGLCYSTCAASLWPMIALVVESRNISTAYGLMMSIQNMGLALAPVFIMPMVPTSIEHQDQYRTIEVIFATLAFGGLICTFLLYLVDRKHGGVLFSGPEKDDLVGQPSPRINPLNPRVSPYLRQQMRFRANQEAQRRVMTPKTPQAIRQQYFRRLRIQSRV